MHVWQEWRGRRTVEEAAAARGDEDAARGNPGGDGAAAGAGDLRGGEHVEHGVVLKAPDQPARAERCVRRRVQPQCPSPSLERSRRQHSSGELLAIMSARESPAVVRTGRLR